MTTRGRTVLPAADRKALDDATKAQSEATKVGTEALVSGARAHAAAQDVVTAQMDANLAKLKASDDARAAAVDAAKRNYTQAVSQYENQPLDSGRFWRNQGTGDKVAYAVAIGLGTLGQIFGGQQRNLVLDSIQNAIKDDIDQQKADLAKKKDVAGIKRTVYTDILTQTGSERLAELGALDMGLKTAQQRIEAALISSKLPQIQAQGQQQLADIQAARAKLNADIDKETVSTATKTEQVLPKKAEAVSPLKDVPKEFLDRHAAAQASLDTLGRIESLGTKDRAGKIKYTYDSIKRTLGLEDADFSRDTAELTRLLMENSKVFGANPSNRDVEILAQSVPELKSNPEAFAQKLAAAKAAADSSLANTERYFPELSQFRKPTIREERLGK
jgi:bifunctional DNA-binding transcriptional regulator/antitoxin component of YhaV-PrlF toxin-antitoxin module